MRILSIDDDTLKRSITETLLAGDVVIMPCDTVYGFVGIVPSSAERIAEIKGRASEKRFLQLILREWLEKFTNDDIEEELLDMSPGKLTFVVKSPEGGTTAVRFPEDNLLKSILEAAGKPLYSTSVNRSGQSILFRSSDIIREFSGDVSLFADAGDLPGRIPSTILDVTSRPYKILRPGACTVPDEFLK